MLTEWPMVGRDEVLRQLVDLLAARRGRRQVVVRGPAGVGKTRLMAEAISRSEDEARPVIHVVGSTAGAEIPFGAVAHLLPDHVAGKDHLTILRGAMRTLEAATTADGVTGCLLAVDDAQWLDSGSAAVVHRATTLASLRLVLTVRDGVAAPDVIGRLASESTSVVIDLQPLTDAQVGTLLERVLEGPVVWSSVRRFARLSEGNPLWLRELVRGAQRRGALVRRGRLWQLDGSPVHQGTVADEVRATTAAMDDGVRDLIAAVALADVIGVDMLEGLFGDEVLATADAHGLLSAERDRRRVQVRLSHPLYGEVVAAELSPLRARRLRLRLADRIAAAGGRRRRDLLRMARWRLDAGDRSHPNLLTAAAHAAGGAQEHRLAGRFAQAAVEAGAGFAARIALGEALQKCGRTPAALEELAKAAEVATNSEERVRAHALRADVLFCSQRFIEAEDALLEAEAIVATAGGRHRIAMQRALFACDTGRLGEAVRLAEATLSDASTTPRVRADAVWVVGYAAPPCGRPLWAVDVIDRESADLAGRFELDYSFGADGLLPARTLAYLWAWRFADVEHIAEVSAGLISDKGDATLWIMRAEGLAALARGRVRHASRLLTDVTNRVDHVYPDPDSLGFFRSAFWSALSEAAALTGDHLAAEEALATAERAWPVPVPYRLTARVWTVAARGDIGAARDLAVDGAAQARDAGAVLLEARLWHDLVRLGDPDRAVPKLDHLADVGDAPQPALYAAHARGLADRDADAVRGAAEAFEAHGVMLLAAEAYTQLATLLRDQGRVTPAVGAGLAALRLADGCEGARTPALAKGEAPLLTARELEIALLAAGGMDDRQIAARLHVSVRTVGSHLYRCYAKLGIHSREGLRDLVS